MIHIYRGPLVKNGEKIKIGLDMDGTITEFPDFFAALTRSDQFEVHIITGRGPEHEEITKLELEKFGIRFDKLHLVDATWAEKGKICKDLGIQIMFDDMDEFIKHISPDTMVFKVRNDGNWNGAHNDWI
jgi:uncharacterized HAD superfamily protein